MWSPQPTLISLFIVPAFRLTGLLAPRGGLRSVCSDAFVPNAIRETRIQAGTTDVARGNID